MLNNPNNPTGAVYPESVVSAMLDLARQHDVWLLSDECYDEVVHERQTVSPAGLAGAGGAGGAGVISAYSFSKTYAMTGWRLGYLAGPGGLVETVTKVLESQSSCASAMTQNAAEAALTGPRTASRW